MSDDEIPIEDAPPTPRSGAPASSSLALATRAHARADLGVSEEPLGSNDGERIREYLKPLGLAPPNEWCAAAFTFWMHGAAADLGVQAPVKGSAGALDLAHQFSEVNLFVVAHEAAAAAREGFAVFWRRPPSTWHGHVGVIDGIDPDGEHFTSIEGNAGDRVARVKHRFDDPLLFGLGRL